MNTDQEVRIDERTVAVENASFKWAYNFLVWPLIIDSLYRQHVQNEEVGDLVALICVSGAIGIAYQIRHRAIVSHWPWKWRTTAIVLAGSFVVAVLIGVLAVLW